MIRFRSYTFCLEEKFSLNLLFQRFSRQNLPILPKALVWWWRCLNDCERGAGDLLGVGAHAKISAGAHHYRDHASLLFFPKFSIKDSKIERKNKNDDYDDDVPIIIEALSLIFSPKWNIFLRWSKGGCKKIVFRTKWGESFLAKKYLVLPQRKNPQNSICQLYSHL